MGSATHAQIFVVPTLLSIIAIVLALLMWVETAGPHEHIEGKVKDPKVAPNLQLAAIMLGGMVASAMFVRVGLTSAAFVRYVAAALEYPTLAILEMQRGQEYRYRRLARPVTQLTPADKVSIEMHQIEVNAQLTRWQQPVRDQQLALIKEGNTGAAMLRLLMNTFGQMRFPMNVTSVLFMFAVPGVGALGFFLMTGIAHMPDPDSDWLWIEYSWQTLNLIFSLLALWKQSGRSMLLHHALNHEFEEEVDGEMRSLLQPGVLLKPGQVRTVAILRIVNVAAQYFVSYFQWAYLPRCLQEIHVFQKLSKPDECTSRPSWGVPVFLVTGMFTDILGNVLLESYIAKSEYLVWPVPDNCGRRLTEAAVDDEDAPDATIGSVGVELAGVQKERLT